MFKKIKEAIQMVKIGKKTTAEKAAADKEKELAKARALIEEEERLNQLKAEQAVQTPKLQTEAVAAASTAPMPQPPSPFDNPKPAAGNLEVPTPPTPPAAESELEITPAQKAEIDEAINYFNEKYSAITLSPESVPTLLFGILQELRIIKDLAK